MMSLRRFVFCLDEIFFFHLHFQNLCSISEIYKENFWKIGKGGQQMAVITCVCPDTTFCYIVIFSKTASFICEFYNLFDINDYVINGTKAVT